MHWVIATSYSNTWCREQKQKKMISNTLTDKEQKTEHLIHGSCILTSYIMPPVKKVQQT
jgi:hypothetical protein